MAAATSSPSWQTTIENQNTQPLSEKPIDPSRDTPDSSDRFSDVTNKNNSNRFAPVEKLKLNGRSKRRSGSVRISHPTKSTATSLIEQRIKMDQRLAAGPPRHYNVRTIPPWVRDADEDDLIEAVEHEYLDSPRAALVAQHNFTPSSARRTATGQERVHTTSSGAKRSDQTSRWISFARASAYPRENFNSEKVDIDWLNKNITDYSKAWLADHDADDPENGTSKYRAFKRKRQAWYKRAQFTILRNPFVPLAFRTTVLLFAAAAIGLGASIYNEADRVQKCLRQDPSVRTTPCIALIGPDRVDYYRDPSALMAIIVDAISIVYTLYITYDEYFSKPLGLRSARAKVRLVLLDLFFIVFQSGNLSLVFESLTVQAGACVVGTEPGTSVRFDRLCKSAQALTGVLTVSLVAWLFTFSVSILRLVERINAR